MIKIYTSLTQLKMAMNGGRLPPMTPLTPAALRYLDPAFTIGMGAFAEDSDHGLRCPVKSCGTYAHNLTLHLNSVHGSIGGASAVRALLGVPPNVGLISARFRSRLSAVAAARWERGEFVMHKRKWTPDQRRAAARRRSATHRSFGARNIRNTCDAQLSHRLIDLEHRLGRSPGFEDGIAAHGNSFVHAVRVTYGSWNAAKAQLGLRVQKYGHTPDDVYESLGEYYRVNGCLPTTDHANSSSRLPLIPASATILRALRVRSWTVAMQQVAFVLGLDDGRYGPNGLPGPARGEDVAGVKLDEDRVREIRARAAKGETYSSLAREYDVSPSNVREIILRRTWKHVAEEAMTGAT